MTAELTEFFTERMSQSAPPPCQFGVVAPLLLEFTASPVPLMM